VKLSYVNGEEKVIYIALHGMGQLIDAGLLYIIPEYEVGPSKIGYNLQLTQLSVDNLE
jgi:hypothetical protein